MIVTFNKGYHLVGFVVGSLVVMSYNFLIKAGKRLFRWKYVRIGSSWGRKRERLGSLHCTKTCSLRIK